MHANPVVHFSVFLNKDVFIFDTSRVGAKDRSPSAAPTSSGLLPSSDRLVSLAFGPPFQSSPEGSLDTHGPLWNCRLEPELGDRPSPAASTATSSPTSAASSPAWCHRITVTSTFSVKRQDTSPVSHSLITLRFGVALVLTMGEYKDYHLLTQHWPFVRMLLHHVTAFGVQSAVSYIGRVLRGSTAKQAEGQCQEDSRGIETLLALRELVHNFVALSWSLPSLTSFSGMVIRPPPLCTPKTSAQSSPAHTPQKQSSGLKVQTQFQQRPQSVDLLLSAALKHIQTTCSLNFLSTVISGCLACSRWREYDMEGYVADDYADHQRQPDALQLRSPSYEDFDMADVDEDGDGSSGSGEGSLDLPDDIAASNTMRPAGILETAAAGEASPPPAGLPPGKRLKLTEANLAANETLDSTILGDDALNPAAAEEQPDGEPRRRCPRIVVLADDDEHGAALLVICAFFFRPGKLAVCEHSAASRSVLPCVMASYTDSAAHPSYPIQWVAHRKRQDVLNDLHNRFSIENEVLLVDPRLLKVTLVRLEKSFSTADVVVSRENGAVTEHDGPVFTVIKIDDVDITANEAIKTAIANSAQAEKKSIGAVNAAESFEGLMELYYHQAQTYKCVVDGGLLPDPEDLQAPAPHGATHLGVGVGGGENASNRSLDHANPPPSTRTHHSATSHSHATMSPRAVGVPPRSPSPMGGGGGGEMAMGVPATGAQFPTSHAAAAAEAAKEATKRYNDAIGRLLGLGADATHLQLLSYIVGLRP